MKRKHIILTLLIFFAFVINANAQVFDLSSAKKSKSVIDEGIFPCVYKPSKLIMGTKTKFIIKAEPNSNVELLTSNQNAGSKILYGKKLRLGPAINSVEGKTGENGVVELDVSMPEEKDLEGQILYFEVLVWKNEDQSDLKIAKIMGINGRETDINAVIVTAPPKNPMLPGFGPSLPGTDVNINRTMDAINQSNEYNDEETNDLYLEQSNYMNTPLMLRNLRVPE